MQRTNLNKANGAISKRLQRNNGKKRVVKNKKVKPSPLMMQKKQRMNKSKKVKNVRSSYQTLHHQPNNMNGQQMQMYAQNDGYQQPMQPMMSPPNGSNPNYQRQSSNSYSDYYEPQRQLLHHHQQQQLQHNNMNMQSPQQVPYGGGYGQGAINHNLTEQEQRLVQSINQRQRNHLNRAVQPSNRANSRRHR